MTVKQLRDQLKAYPDNLEVWVSQDPEGNALYELAGLFNIVQDENKTPQPVIYPLSKLTRV